MDDGWAAGCFLLFYLFSLSVRLSLSLIVLDQPDACKKQAKPNKLNDRNLK